MSTSRKNGSKVAKRLLEFDRKIHKVLPSSRRQLRPIIYSSAGGAEADPETRVRVLDDGAFAFISREQEEMDSVLNTLAHMYELQKEMQHYIHEDTWVSRIMKNLGCGISIVDRNWKIWYCSEKNAESSGLDINAFHDRVCWREYHRFDGRIFPCPECPANMVMQSELCGSPHRRYTRCITERLPFEHSLHACKWPNNIGGVCNQKGERLQACRNFLLAPLRDSTPKWLYVLASPSKQQTEPFWALSRPWWISMKYMTGSGKGSRWMEISQRRIE